MSLKRPLVLTLYNPDSYVFIALTNTVLQLNQKADNGRRFAMDFEISMSDSYNPNKGVIQVYGLNAATMSSIKSDGLSIEVYTGFNEEFKNIFKGDISNVQIIKLNPGWAIKIAAGDGLKSFTESTITKTFASGTEKEGIVKEVIKSMGLAVKIAKDAITGKTDGDVSLDGLSKDSLKKMVSSEGSNWMIQDGEVHISKKGEPIDKDAILITSTTGLLEPPTVTEKGLNIRSVLNPDFKPGKLIKVESISAQFDPSNTTATDYKKEYDGFYIIQSCTLVGNNYGGPFDAVLETKSYDK